MSKTINFFKEISQIPRESGNEENIAKYLCEFAKARGLEYEIDEYNNVLIRKKTADRPGIILQGHTDMVCVSSNPDFDFSTSPIEVIEEDGYLHANNTTLGADNGIGVAQMLNILDSDIPCNIEAVFTSSEETTMVGAEHFDASKLKGKYLLNLDGFDENLIINESAAYYDIVLKGNKKEKESMAANTYEVSLTGLLGGHSGYDVDKNRGNAIILLAEFLKECKLDICSFKGGNKNNVFPNQATAIVCTDEDLESLREQFLETVKSKFPDVQITITKKDEKKTVFEDPANYLEFICNFPSKVINYNEEKEPTTSINFGVINDFNIEVGMRSSREKEANDALNMLKEYAKKYNFEFIKDGYQPGFYSDKSSPLITKLIETCPYEPKAQAKSLHITVEAGFFQEKISDLDIAIISPNIKDAHSVKERVSIESIEMTDKWLEEFLEKFIEN